MVESSKTQLTNRFSQKTEFDRNFEEEFFVIDSNNLDKVKTRLYGYMLSENEIIQNENLKDDIEISSDGLYILIQNQNNLIRIFQDYNGSMGLYYYKNDNYFAISNSFLKLVEYLKNIKKITLNKDYANSFMASGFCSMVYKETLINEIEAIPRNYIININKDNKEVNFEKIDYEEKTIPINSVEGLKTLDKWFYKWIKIIRKIKSKSNHLAFELTGGFDSRMIFTLPLSANIDLNKIQIKCANDDKAHHREDYRIASKIADKFNFKMNQNVFPIDRTYFKDIITILKISSYLKLGFHNQFQYKTYKENETLYLFGGYGGETVREFFNQTPEKFIESRKKACWDSCLKESTGKIFENTFKYLKEDFNLKDNSKELTDHIYSETRSRNHFGKSLMGNFYSNVIILSPFFDRILHTIQLNDEECDDKNLLMAIIFTRYCPELLNVEFDHNRKINENTIEHARKVNEVYPFEKKELDYISGPPINLEPTNNDIIYTIDDLNEFLSCIHKTQSFKEEFLKLYPERLYDKILNYSKTQINYPHTYTMQPISLLKTINDINHGPDFEEWLKNYLFKEIENNLYEYNLFLDKDYITKEEKDSLDSENKKLKEENKELKRFKNDVLTSNSWKITKPLRSLKRNQY
ncbi:MAG: hypothetical protein ACI37V_01005 [Methanobrevibacter sp.]